MHFYPSAASFTHFLNRRTLKRAELRLSHRVEVGPDVESVPVRSAEGKPLGGITDSTSSRAAEKVWLNLWGLLTMDVNASWVYVRVMGVCEWQGRFFPWLAHEDDHGCLSLPTVRNPTHRHVASGRLPPRLLARYRAARNQHRCAGRGKTPVFSLPRRSRCGRLWEQHELNSNA
jgi:hypothetical protein